MKIDTTEIVAWWGAIIATFVLAWDIYKWATAGAKIRLSVSSGMQMAGVNSYWETDAPDKLHIVIKLSNYGDRSTTITHLIFYAYPNWFSRLRGKRTHAFIANNPNPAQPIPHELKSGSIWMGFVHQTPDLERLATDGHLMCDVVHSHTTKSKTTRVLIKMAKPQV